MTHAASGNHQLKVVPFVTSILVGYGYANLFMMFVLQHLIAPEFHIPALIILTALFFIPIRLAVYRAIQSLNMLPVTTRGWFIGLMSVCGIFLYLQGPVPPPNITGWANISLLSAIEPVNKFLTIVIVGTSGFGFLLIVAIGTQSPIHTRFVSVTLFFSVYLVVGLFIYADYGMSVDEIYERKTSLVSANYVVQNFNPDLAVQWFGEDLDDISTYRDRHYGVAFQLPLAMVESLNNWDDDIRDVWIYRHFAVFLFYFCGVVAFYRLAYEKFASWQFGLIGATFLVFTPHIFGQTFNNIKDTVFLSAFTMALYCAFRYWRQRTIPNAITFGVVTAFASNIRIIALFLVIFVTMYQIILELFSSKQYSNRRTKRQTLLSILVIFITFFPLHVLFFPASWRSPVYFNLETLFTFARFSRWNDSIAYMGNWTPVQDVAWHYLPVWLMLTIPLTYQILFLLGVTSIVRLGIKERLSVMRGENRDNMIFFILFIVPVLVLIGLDAVIYNDWRQFYFLYVPFLLIALHGLNRLWKMYIHSQSNIILRRSLAVCLVLIGVYQAFLAYWIIANHPYQNVFRTTPIVELFGGRNQFDGDVLRASSRQGFEYVLNVDDRNPLRICIFNGIIGFGNEILPSEDVARLEIVDNCEAGAYYAINGYLNPLKIYDDLSPAIYIIQVDGNVILSVHSLD